MNSATKKLTCAWWLLRITYGILFILVGTDKFFNALTQWHQFIGSVTDYFPIHPVLILKGLALLQILAGILLFTPWIRIGIYLMIGLLLIIVCNLITASPGIVVIAHALVMIICLLVLDQFTLIMQKLKLFC